MNSRAKGQRGEQRALIARVFPRRTRATPTDALAFIGGPVLDLPKVDAVHVSVVFIWDIPYAKSLQRAWEQAYGGRVPVLIGGPATGEAGGDFEPGMYLRDGYTITSRGCPNQCWFCSVWTREGNIRELPIRDGWNVLDDNLLACSDSHIRAVFAMLKRQPRPAEFTGGLESARLKPWHAEALAVLKPRQVFFAYDEESDYEPLSNACHMLWGAGFREGTHAIRAYVLIGYPGDTTSAAERRLRQCVEMGVVPMAMLWRNEKGQRDREWARFQRRWARPAIICGSVRTSTEQGVLAL